MKRPARLDILYAVTASVTAEAFLRGQLKTAAAQGRVGLVVGDEAPTDLAEAERVNVFSVRLPRSPKPSADVPGFIRLLWLVACSRPRVAVFGTPKMGFLAACATWLCRTPKRIYVVHGLRWEGLSGARRRLLQALERLACAWATDVVAVSPSVRRRLVEDMHVRATKVRIVHHGSANGIDAEAFAPLRGSARRRARARWGVPDHAMLYVFVGRLTRDKGIRQLPVVWCQIADRVPGAHLLVVGPSEAVDDIDDQALADLADMPSVTMLGHSLDLEECLAMTDVNLSLSRREGMSTVILEAAACEVPTVGFAVTGVVDAVAPGTGALVKLDALEEFAEAAATMGSDSEARATAGRKARHRVLRDFAQEDIWSAWNALLLPDGGDG